MFKKIWSFYLSSYTEYFTRLSVISYSGNSAASFLISCAEYPQNYFQILWTIFCKFLFHFIRRIYTEFPLTSFHGIFCRFFLNCIRRICHKFEFHFCRMFFRFQSKVTCTIRHKLLLTSHCRTFCRLLFNFISRIFQNVAFKFINRILYRLNLIMYYSSAACKDLTVSVLTVCCTVFSVTHLTHRQYFGILWRHWEKARQFPVTRPRWI